MPQTTIPCKHCGEPTNMLGTRQCNSCWEERRSGRIAQLEANLAKADLEWKNDPRTKEMFLVLLKCRDALPAITKTRLKLYNVPADLDKQIEKCIEPWVVPPGTPGAL